MISLRGQIQVSRIQNDKANLSTATRIDLVFGSSAILRAYRDFVAAWTKVMKRRPVRSDLRQGDGLPG